MEYGSGAIVDKIRAIVVRKIENKIFFSIFYRFFLPFFTKKRTLKTFRVRMHLKKKNEKIMIKQTI